MFHKILIANRGEIAVRIIRACRELGVATVVAHSEADRHSLAVDLADEAICIGPATSDKSYLNISNVVSAALVSGAEAIHPGYGFLSENAYLAEVCEQCQITFIGPTAKGIERFHDKSAAREMMREAGLPVLPGIDRPVYTLDAAQKAAAEIGYPVMVKACAGGGGRGLRPAFDETELARSFPVAQREAQSAFGNGGLYLEKLVEEARHVEVQVLVDRYGKSVHFGERDCSLQRRHQKMLEESPCIALDSKVRAEMGERAAAAAAAVGYEGVGTIEFLVDGAGRYSFMEMNTRIQVEHPVSEMTTGVDLLKWQMRVAAGEPLGFNQSDIAPRGHAIECRVNAEDPARGFAPQSGLITGYVAPGGPGIRVDSHLYPGYQMPPYYDSLLAKVIAWGEDRAEAVARMRRALDEFRLNGVATNIPLQLELIGSPEFLEGRFDTHFVERWLADREAAVAEAGSAPGLHGE
ncbi:MAG TPA: acetyl-CoA carboxylase biotin carboxylase subunit [Chloroflexota bacterium]|nr:acetyl-CoA carboxylase biotin carboxylase subunit [Chloroflexota bacterium]